jgi:hypothetical protein
MKIKLLILALVLALSLLAAGAALADNGFELPRWVLGSGATDATAGSVSLHATLGQPIVGVVSSGQVSLGQGFWHGGSRGQDIYLPLVLK